MIAYTFNLNPLSLLQSYLVDLKLINSNDLEFRNKYPVNLIKDYFYLRMNLLTLNRDHHIRMWVNFFP